MAKPDLFALASAQEAIEAMQYEIDKRNLVIACLVSALKRAKIERLCGPDLTQARGALRMGLETIGAKQ